MNYTTVKHPVKRYTTAYSSTLKIQYYGEDNLYPQRMCDLLDNSPTGSTCFDRYRTFIEGNGLYDEKLAEYVCNTFGDSVDDVFRLVAEDVAKYNGFALHVTYNLEAKITGIQHIPFASCRLDEEDDDGRVPFITIHPDWEGRKTRRGKTLSVTRKYIRKIYPFNPNPRVVFSQIEKDGGIHNYRGQILWCSLNGRNNYPKAVHDKIVTELSIDEGLSNVKYRNVRNNFLLSGMIVRKKGSMLGVDDNGNEVLQSRDDEFLDSIESFQGDVNACSIMDVTVQNEEDQPKFISVEGANFDKKFQTTETSTVERIYSAYGQEPWYCIRVGKVGFSGDVLREAYEYYNSYVEPQRRVISRILKRVFDSWHEDIGVKDFSIEPLIYQYNYMNGNLDETQKENGQNGHNNTD